MSNLDTFNSPNYKVEIWFTYGKKDAEDELEEQFRDFLKHNGMTRQGGPVVFAYNFPA